MVSISDHVDLFETLGKGGFGEVKKAKLKGDDTIYAAKIIDKNRDLNKHYKAEEAISKSLLVFPGIVRLKTTIDLRDKFYLLYEYCNMGSLRNFLQDYLKARNRNILNEAEVRWVFKPLISTMMFIHNSDILHRDLKQDNILVNCPGTIDREMPDFLERLQYKIADFGLSKQVSQGDMVSSIVGTPYLMDPRILNSKVQLSKDDLKYGKEADIWSLGVILYELLVGRPPFRGKNTGDLMKAIETGMLKVPRFLSKQAVCLIMMLLKYEGNERLTIEQIRDHPFLTDDIDKFQYIHPEGRKKSPLVLNIKEDQSSKVEKAFHELFKDK